LGDRPIFEAASIGGNLICGPMKQVTEVGHGPIIGGRRTANRVKSARLTGVGGLAC